jgi:tyrosine-protein phosphatase SIW14
MKNVRSLAIAAASCAALCSLAFSQQTAPPSQHSVDHLTAEKLDVRGIPKLGEVTPMLYRGGQPTKGGFAELAKMDVKIVVDLRGDRKKERDIVNKLGMQYVALHWFCPRPKDRDFALFLELLRKNPDEKVFVHCRTGIDRTGVMVASYRIVEQGWTAEEAMKEMKAFGFNRFHETICMGLASYEKSFPQRYDSDPVFASLRELEQQTPHPPQPEP